MSQTRIYKGPLPPSMHPRRATGLFTAFLPVGNAINERGLAESARARLLMERRRKGKDATQGKDIANP